MCGIAGIAGQACTESRSWLQAASRTISHRGPDDVGEWWSERIPIGLAHRRLAILGLGPQGHQPMSTRDGRFTIVFNGEIYNHGEVRHKLQKLGFHFGTKTDTEVILYAYAAWGKACLSFLEGMFAFAIVDEENGELLLARDRIGEKPLFYTRQNGTLRFASELTALLSSKESTRNIDSDALDRYLAFGYLSGDASLISGTKKLPPAHSLTFHLKTGQLHLERYWQYSNQAEKDLPRRGHRLEDVAEELLHTLNAAVKRQMIADVPVGILLSGGVDSSLISALAVQSGTKVRTFNVGGASLGTLDEAPHARLVAQALGTEHHEITIESTPDLLIKVAESIDEPLGDSSILPTWLVCNAVRKHCTVALGGDGGDELFGGYRSYNYLRGMALLGRWAPPKLLSGIGKMLRSAPRPRMRGYMYASQLDFEWKRALPRLNVIFDPQTRAKLLDQENPTHAAEDWWTSATPIDEDIVDRATLMDMENYLPGDILTKVDRAAMLNSLELRAPFLDVSVLKFVSMRVPSHLKAGLIDRKILLRHLAKRLLPDAFEARRKQGFTIPISSWFQKGLIRAVAEDVLLSPTSLFNHTAIRNIIDRNDRTGRQGERLFALLMLQLWANKNKVALA